MGMEFKFRHIEDADQHFCHNATGLSPIMFNLSLF